MILAVVHLETTGFEPVLEIPVYFAIVLRFHAECVTYCVGDAIYYFIACGVWRAGLQKIGDLLFEPIFPLKAMLEPDEPSSAGRILICLAHPLSKLLFPSIHHGDNVLGLRVLCGVQVLIAVASPGACWVS